MRLVGEDVSASRVLDTTVVCYGHNDSVSQIVIKMCLLRSPEISVVVFLNNIGKEIVPSLNHAGKLQGLW